MRGAACFRDVDYIGCPRRGPNAPRFGSVTELLV